MINYKLEAAKKRVKMNHESLIEEIIPQAATMRGNRLDSIWIHNDIIRAIKESHPSIPVGIRSLIAEICIDEISGEPSSEDLIDDTIRSGI